ncbi:WGxxGxxG family protein [Cognatilysobacter bugurensis]|uniref:WGxxGxxG-CTERM domain-containing protein n=1 Tax=Cognatilysobacter bugurensis TaxID=543356 RepID=A0A918W9L3_9GAMM|nr:WGxxGxxG family protein [Lysobacter bugurensis]GHA80410.1 hypothetical protein GCM10007067_17720 [Lysobacter bugurensis]
MKVSKPLTAAVAAALLAGAFSMPVAAQVAETAEAERVEVERDDDDGFDWGLLGLLGLLGLIPRKRHDTVVRHDAPRH